MKLKAARGRRRVVRRRASLDVNLAVISQKEKRKTKKMMKNNDSLCSFNETVFYVACKGFPESRDIPDDLCSLRDVQTVFFVTFHRHPISSRSYSRFPFP
ncbi:hypothetical protein P5V15_012363 [Pogonomyrmex californicus]